MKKLFLTSLFLFIHSLLFAQAGVLDSTFGVGGKAVVNHEYSEGTARDVSIGKDGKIVILSGHYLIRMSSDGTMDSSFGSYGIVDLFGLLLYGQPKAIEVDDSNRIIVVSTNEYDSDHEMRVYRILADGSNDNTFYVYYHPFEVSRALMIESDGKILIGGQNDYGYEVPRLTRINEDGEIDSSFDLTFYSNQGFIFALAEQTDGKILAAGTSDGNCFMVRILSNGIVDSLFGNDGFIYFDDGNEEAAQGISVLPDGKIIVVGHSETTLTSSIMCWRFLEDGSPDFSFGNNGEEILFSGSNCNFPWFVITKSDSTTIVGASLFDGANTIPAVYKINYDGSIDSSYGNNGIAAPAFECGKFIEIAGDTTSDGELMVCGTGFFNGNSKGVISKITENGKSDSSFSEDGSSSFTTTAFSGFDYQGPVFDFITLENGKILGAADYLLLFRLNENGSLDSTYETNGFFSPNHQQLNQKVFMASDSENIYAVQFGYSIWQPPYENLIDKYARFSILKLHADGTRDSSCGANGIAEHVFDNYGGLYPLDFAIQPGHKLLIAMADYKTLSNVLLLRFNNDGSLDSSFATNGIQNFENGISMWGAKIEVRDDGKILCAYANPLPLDSSSILLFQLMPDGSYDSSFCGTGYKNIRAPFYFKDFLLQSDNKVNMNGSVYGDLPNARFLRINEDGSIDTTYGNEGILTPPTVGYYFSTILQPNDEMLLAQDEGSYSTSVYRYLEEGKTDSLFGSYNKKIINGLISNAHSYPMHLDVNEKILIAGLYVSGGFATGYGIVRLKNEDAVSVVDINNNIAFNIFPNPTSDLLTITTPNTLNNRVTITITDISGKILREQKENLSNGNYTIDVSAFSPGIYLMNILTDKNSYATKFVKE